jgi:hypothetical protein
VDSVTRNAHDAEALASSGLVEIIVAVVEDREVRDLRTHGVVVETIRQPQLHRPRAGLVEVITAAAARGVPVEQIALVLGQPVEVVRLALEDPDGSDRRPQRVQEPVHTQEQRRPERVARR